MDIDVVEGAARTQASRAGRKGWSRVGRWSRAARGPGPIVDPASSRSGEHSGPDAHTKHNLIHKNNF